MSVLQLCRWKFSLKETLQQSDFIQLKLTFIPKKGKVRFLSYPLGDLEGKYALHL